MANHIDFSHENEDKLPSFKVTNKICEVLFRPLIPCQFNNPLFNCTFPCIDSNLFVRRREEHKNLLQHLRTEKYEKRYKLIELAFQKIVNVSDEFSLKESY